MPAHDIESAVVERTRTLLSDRSALASLSPGSPNLATTLARAAMCAARLETPAGKRSPIGALVARIDIGKQGIDVELDRPALHRLLHLETSEHGAPLVLSVPAIRIRHGKATKLILTSGQAQAAGPNPALIALLGEARSARVAVLASPGQTIKQVAASIGQCRSRLAKLVRLSWLAPEIVDAVLEGRHPPRLTPRRLLEAALPTEWVAQKATLAFP